jgi:DNA invertase Pin-like site-specific DNA recombinase
MNQNIQKIKYFSYLRKSSEQEDRQVLSIDSQKSELEPIAIQEKMEIVDWLPESHSAKHPGRPVFDEMFRRIERGEANAIFAWHANRLSRNSVDTGKIIYLLDIGKLVEVRTLSQVFHNTPNDKFLLNLFCSQAKLENDNKGEDVKRGLKHKADMGWLPSGAKPGYMNDPYGEKGSKTLKDDPVRFPIIQEAWRLMLTGTWTPPKILEYINAELGYRTPKKKKIGGKPMSRSQIYEIFKDPFYYGPFEFPVGSGNWKEGLHNKMITEAEFWRVQGLLGRAGRPRPKSLVHDFVGMMGCGECGGTIIADEKNQLICTGCKFKFSYLNRKDCPKCNLGISDMKQPKILKYIFWRCSRKKNPNCSQGSIEEKDLERQILGKIDSLEIPPEFHTFALKWFRKEAAKDADVTNRLVASQQKAYNSTLEKIQGIIDMRAAQEITKEEFAERKATLSQEKLRIEALMAQAGETVDAKLRKAEELFTFIDDAKEKFKNGSPQDRRLVLSRLGSNLTIESKKLNIDMEERLLPIQKLSPIVLEIHRRLEPEKNQLKQSDYEAEYLKNPLMLRIVDNVRTVIQRQNEYVYIPDLRLEALII